MPAQQQKTNVLLDWFTVSYRSVAAGVVLVIALAVAAGWYFFFYAPSKPRQAAQEAISLAEERLAVDYRVAIAFRPGDEA